jgi:hypothetical protein
MNGLSTAGHTSHHALVVTSRPKELYQQFQGFTDQVRAKTDELKMLIGSKDFLSKAMIIAVDLQEIAEQASRDAARTMEEEPELSFFRIS